MSYNNSFSKLIDLPGTILRIIGYIHIQKNFLQQNIDPIIENSFEINDGSLDQKDIDKINNYYGLAVPAILGEAFCVLRGTPMTQKERWASTSQGAMTGLFDDFFDKDYLSDDAVKKMMQLDNDGSPKRSNQKLFEVFYTKALENAPDPVLVQEALRAVYEAQVESKKQETKQLTAEEMLDITFFKGGSSVAFYRTVFSPEATGKEKELIYKLGSLMQLANDIFDIYKDRESGIRTLLTETKHISGIRILLKSHLDEYYNAAFELGYSVKNTRSFLNILSIGIFSRCFVCLDQLEGLEKLTGNQFEVSKYSRKQLICDMDKKINMLRSAKKHITDIC